MLSALPILGAIIALGTRQVITEASGAGLWRPDRFLVYLSSVICIVGFGKAADAHLEGTFGYRYELSILIVAPLLFLAGIIVHFRGIPNASNTVSQATAIFLIFCANSMSVGYSEGKKLFNEADRVFFLENHSICETTSVNPWVLVGHISSRTIFMNTIDKRLCITEEKNYILIPRALTLAPG